MTSPQSIDQDHGPQRQRWLPVALAGVSFGLILIQICNHVMWRDEIRTWQLMRECSSPTQIVAAMQYDAVPVLWNFIVWVLTRISGNPFIMQLTHAAIATATVYCVARWAPFSSPTKVIYAFGYYPLFEYAAITRNYALIFLLMMIACVLISQPRVKLLWLTLVLGLLSQVSIWGMGFAMLLTMAAIARVIWTEADFRSRWWEMAVCVVVVGVGAGLCLLEVRPGPSPSFTGTWLDAVAWDRVKGMAAATYLAWVPIPAWSPHFWNTNILDPIVGLQAILGILMLAGVLLLLSRRPIALGLMLAGAGGLMLFEWRFKGVARHHGHIFMLLIGACWLAETTPAWNFGSRFERFRGKTLLGLLIVNAIAGIAAMTAGLAIPFSASWATAQLIRQNVGPDVVLAGFDDYCSCPVAQWLERDMYFPQMRKFARVNTQNGAERYLITSYDDLFSQLIGVAEERNAPVLLLLTEGPERDILKDDFTGDLPPTLAGQKRSVNIKKLGTMLESVVRDEGERLYLVTVVKR